MVQYTRWLGGRAHQREEELLNKVLTLGGYYHDERLQHLQVRRHPEAHDLHRPARRPVHRAAQGPAAVRRRPGRCGPAHEPRLRLRLRRAVHARGHRRGRADQARCQTLCGVHQVGNKRAKALLFLYPSGILC